MRNAATATGINAGELSEYVQSLCILKADIGREVEAVHEQIRRSSDPTRATVTAPDGRDLQFVHDGKTALAIEEVEQHLRVRPNPVVSDLIAVGTDVTRSLRSRGELPRTIDSVTNVGAKSRCDVRVVGTDNGSQRAETALSLKFGHENAYRHQTPDWAKTCAAYRRAGLDISGFAPRYDEYYRRFIGGGRRYSADKADYDPALLKATSLLLQATDELNRYICQHLHAIFRPDLAGAGFVELYCGDEPAVIFVDMHSGGIRQVRRSDAQALTDVLRAAAPGIEAQAERTDSGRTLDLTISVERQRLITLRTTASTNHAPGTRDPDVRVPKPQTYFNPDITLLT